MIIVGLTGLKTAGKTTVARKLITDYQFKQVKFATCLKDMLRCMLKRRLQFSSYDVEPYIERMIEGDLREVPSPLLNGKSPRHAMQTLGTEWGRDCIDQNIWVDTEIDYLENLEDTTPGPHRFVFDDVRFPNEADAIRQTGGVLMRVERPEATEIVDTHASESFVIIPDLILDNSKDLEYLYQQIDENLKPYICG